MLFLKDMLDISQPLGAEKKVEIAQEAYAACIQIQPDVVGNKKTYRFTLILEFNEKEYDFLDFTNVRDGDKPRPELTDQPWSQSESSDYDNFYADLETHIGDTLFRSTTNLSVTLASGFVENNSKRPGYQASIVSNSIAQFTRTIIDEGGERRRIRERDIYIRAAFRCFVEVTGVGLTGTETLPIFGGVTADFELSDMPCPAKPGDAGFDQDRTTNEIRTYYEPSAPLNKFDRFHYSVLVSDDNQVVNEEFYEPFPVIQASLEGAVLSSGGRDVVFQGFFAPSNTNYNTITLRTGDSALENYTGKVSVAIYDNDILTGNPGNKLRDGEVEFTNENIRNKFFNVSFDTIQTTGQQLYWVAVDATSNLPLVTQANLTPAASLTKIIDQDFAVNGWPADLSGYDFGSDSSKVFHYMLSYTAPSSSIQNYRSRNIDRIRFPPGIIDCGRVTIIQQNGIDYRIAIDEFIPIDQAPWRDRVGQLWTITYSGFLIEDTNGFVVGEVITEEQCITIPPPVVKHDRAYCQSWKAPWSGDLNRIYIRLHNQLPDGSKLQIAVYDNIPLSIDGVSEQAGKPSDRLTYGALTFPVPALGLPDQSLPLSLTSTPLVEGNIYWVVIWIQSANNEPIALYSGNNNSEDRFYVAKQTTNIATGSEKLPNPFAEDAIFEDSKVGQFWFSLEGTGTKCGGGSGGDVTINGALTKVEISPVSTAISNREIINYHRGEAGILPSDFTIVRGRWGNTGASSEIETILTKDHLNPSSGLWFSNSVDTQPGYLNGPFDTNPDNVCIAPGQDISLSIKSVTTSDTAEGLCLTNLKFAIKVSVKDGSVDFDAFTSFSVWGRIKKSNGVNVLIKDSTYQVVDHNAQGNLVLSKTNISSLDNSTGEKASYVFNVDWSPIIKCVNNEDLVVDLRIFASAKFVGGTADITKYPFKFELASGNPSAQWNSGEAPKPIFTSINISEDGVINRSDQ